MSSDVLPDDAVERRKLGVNKERTTEALKGFIWSISHNSCNIISHQSGQLQRLLEHYLEPYAAQTWRSMIPCLGETRWPANGRAQQSLNNLPCRKTHLKYDIALEILKSVKPAKHLHELLRLFWEKVAPHMTWGCQFLLRFWELLFAANCNNTDSLITTGTDTHKDIPTMWPN